MCHADLADILGGRQACNAAAYISLLMTLTILQADTDFALTATIKDGG